MSQKAHLGKQSRIGIYHSLPKVDGTTNPKCEPGMGNSAIVTPWALGKLFEGCQQIIEPNWEIRRDNLVSLTIHRPSASRVLGFVRDSWLSTVQPQRHGFFPVILEPASENGRKSKCSGMELFRHQFQLKLKMILQVSTTIKSIVLIKLMSTDVILTISKALMKLVLTEVLLPKYLYFQVF